MRLNNQRRGMGMPSPEENLFRWNLFKRICTVTKGDTSAIREVWEMFGYTVMDLEHLKTYRRRQRMLTH